MNFYYSKVEGLKRTLKNMGIMFALPAILYLLAQVNVIVPKQFLPIAIPIAGGLTYFVKNWFENKD